VQLGLRLPSRKRFFRRGQELARFAVLKQPARFSPKKAFALGCAAMGGACDQYLTTVHSKHYPEVLKNGL